MNYQLPLNDSFYTGSSGYGPGDKRRKITRVSALTYLLDESDVLDDLKIINKSKAISVGLFCSWHLSAQTCPITKSDFLEISSSFKSPDFLC